MVQGLLLWIAWTDPRATVNALCLVVCAFLLILGHNILLLNKYDDRSGCALGAFDDLSVEARRSDACQDGDQSRLRTF